MDVEGWGIWTQSMEKGCIVHFLEKSSYAILAQNLKYIYFLSIL